mmetsp:Transcript_10613/g.23740  ORF Transcript_10613/g.23740 Transcript_10613/m.23740 type:complete len:232 (+) Transcript_10613:731-1426(+)
MLHCTDAGRTCRLQYPSPSLLRAKPSKPDSASSSVASSTIAPAPSPKRMQVPLSSQSRKRVRASAPITSTFLYAPEFMNCDAVTSPYRNPEQAAVRSKAAAFLAPIMLATEEASPKRSSGDEVATMTKSMSNASTPAFVRASIADVADISLSDVPSSMSLLFLMPVRFPIHASFVSTRETKASLGIVTCPGHAPTPMGLHFTYDLPFFALPIATDCAVFTTSAATSASLLI